MQLSKVTAAAINQNEFDLTELARRMHVNAAAVMLTASEPFDETGMDAGWILESTAAKLREAANLVAHAAQLLGIAELPPMEPLEFRIDTLSDPIEARDSPLTPNLPLPG
jgi:hypothetical protein